MSDPAVRYLRVPALLEQLARARSPQTLGQLALRLNVPKSTLRRIVSSLMDAGFVVQAPGEQGFALGPRATRLALATLDTPRFTRAAQALLAKLSSVTGEACNLTAPDGDSMRYLARVETRHPLHLPMDIGSRVPLHCTATGKLMLALMSPAERLEALDRIELVRRTPRTIVDRRELEQALVKIAQRRVGVDDEEFVTGMVAVAVPVVDEAGRMLAALACHGPTARVSIRALMRSVPAMTQAARTLAAVLGAEGLTYPAE